VTRYNAVRVIDQNRVGKTKPPDGIGDLGNLLLGVRAGWLRGALGQPGLDKRWKVSSDLVLSATS
jgi:hypothetical protein